MKYGDVVERLGIKLRTMLPRKLTAFLGYNYRKQRFLRYLRQTFGERVKPQEQGPIAPPELIETEALMQRDDLGSRATPEWYFGSGYRDAWAVAARQSR